MEENKKKNITPLIISLSVMILVTIFAIGRTLSFFAVNKKDSGTISGTVAAGGLSIEVSKILPTNTYEAKKLIPQLDSAITSAVKGTVSPCIDDNENAVCNVYKIEVTNNGGPTKVWGNIELNNSTSPNLKWASINTNSDTNPTTVSLNGKVKKVINTKLSTEESYNAGETKTYYIVVWISETGSAQNDSGEYTGTAIFSTVAPAMSPSETTLSNLNLVSNGELELPITDVETSNAGIFEMEDDLGTSYYFRGSADDNYVKFGKWKTDWYVYYDSENDTIETTTSNCDGEQECIKIASAGDDMYWRIVRINGDGTIRMIYDGTQTYRNFDFTDEMIDNFSDEDWDALYISGLKRSIGYTEFNINGDDNAYVGYMYGTPNSITYNQTHANTNNSTIKTYIDNWYRQQLSGTTYESNIADAIYCNDRKVATNVSNYQAWWGDESKTVGTGINTSDTLYGIFDRLTYDMNEDDITEINPILTCPQVNDQFTLTTSNKGNKKLTYPVGLITADEIILAGGYTWRNNFNYYLTTGTYYWSGEPSDSISDYVWSVDNCGSVNDYGVFELSTARPLVSLSSSTNFTGSGTLSDPFVVSNNG